MPRRPHMSHSLFIRLTLPTDLQEAVASRQKLEAQKQENLGVQSVRLCPRALASAFRLRTKLG